MNNGRRQAIKDYEIRRFHRLLDRLRTLYSKMSKHNFIKLYFFNRKIIKETKIHFSILSKLYNNNSKK